MNKRSLAHTVGKNPNTKGIEIIEGAAFWRSVAKVAAPAFQVCK